MDSFDIKSLPAPLRAVAIIVQRFWFAWCCLATMLIGVVALVCYIFIFNFTKPQNAKRYAFYVTKYWGKALLALMLVRVTSEGEDNLCLEGGSYIIVSNHASIVDVPLCMATSPIQFSFLAKQEVDRLPIIGFLARNMHVYVDRKCQESRRQTFGRMKAHIEDGHSIHIYAEGTRNRTDELLQGFYNGAFKLAIDTQHPIAVMTICGSEKASDPRDPFLACPASVHCIWDEPISTVGMTVEKDMKRLKTMVRDRILYNLEYYHAEYRV
ncbi:MAG: 1-acyl-sn-glycerol-3-phosphate acyltransferase [Saprospiraceae bacterium]|nr:1-acyl-sn-glycerol-3-phosphate acyltransferase [Saprospiraceae bacterium]